MKTKSPLQNQCGFTLVEMLVAFLLMTIGVITTLSMITTAIQSNSIANKLTTKASLAQQVMEDLLSKKIDDDFFASSATNAVYDLEPASPGNNIIINGAGTFHAEYSTLINTPQADITELVITITSVPADSKPFSITCYKRTL